MSDGVAAAMIDALNALSSPYMVVGSLSSSYYGIPRSTQDADFVLHFQGTSVRALAERLGPEFLLDPLMSFETVTRTHRYVIRHAKTPFKIELFLLSDDSHDQERFSRRLPARFMERPTFMPTAEDVIVTKLRWPLLAGRLTLQR